MRKATIEEAQTYSLATDPNVPAGRTPPQLVSAMRPVIPSALRGIDLNTEVRVQFIVNEEGSVVNVTITTPSPYEALNRAAVEAVSQWRYKPAMRDGVIIPAQVSSLVKFQSRR